MNDSYMPFHVRTLFRCVSLVAGDQFIAAGNRTARYYFPKRKDVIPIVPAPIQTDVYYRPAVDPDPEILKLDGVRIVMVGNVNPVKGYHTLIRAVALANRLTTRAFHVIGVGRMLENQSKYIAELEKYLRDEKIENFHFWGASNRVKQILAAADFYVCASDFEASPISVWEAMSMSLPVVSTDVGDVKSVFQQVDCGRVVSAGNPEKLAKAMVELIEMDASERARLGDHAREIAVQQFDTSICVGHHERIYRAMIG